MLLKFVQHRRKILENIKGSEKADTRYIKPKSTLTFRSAFTIAMSNNTSATRSQATSESSREVKDKKCP